MKRFLDRLNQKGSKLRADPLKQDGYSSEHSIHPGLVEHVSENQPYNHDTQIDAGDYTFQPLEQEEFRLVHIAPAAHQSDPVKCVITHHLRREMPEYTAISYTWGSHSSLVHIECSSLSFRVTSSCEQAIRAVRDSERPLTLWIDGICIDQNNAAEKSNQVAQMGEIYRLAKRTLVYLGPTDRQWDIFDPEISNKDWQDLFERKWFLRTWVIQETVLSKHLIVVIGYQQLPWSDLLQVCESRKLQRPFLMELRTGICHDYGMRPPKSWQEDHFEDGESDDVMDALTGSSSRQINAHRDPLYGLGDKYTATDSLYGSEPQLTTTSSSNPGMLSSGKYFSEAGSIRLNYWQLPQLLSKTRQFQCQDARDKLFALLPLFSRPLPPLIAPDYSKQTTDVYRDLTLFLLQQDDPNSFANVAGPTAKKIPSWTYDWTNETPPSLSWLTKKTWSKAREQWRTGFATGEREIRFSLQGPDGLRLRGLLLGKTKHLTLTRRIYVHEIYLQEHLSVGIVIHANEMQQVRNDVGFILDSKPKLLSSIWRMSPALEAFTKSLKRRGYEVRDALSKEESFSFIQKKEPSNLIQKTVKNRSNRTELETVDELIEEHFPCSEHVNTLQSLQSDRKAWSSRRETVMHGATEPLVHEFDGSPQSVGQQGVFPISTEIGDIACILLGFPCPFVLRPSASGADYRLIGECYINDAMEGQLLDWTLAWSQNNASLFEEFIIR